MNAARIAFGVYIVLGIPLGAFIALSLRRKVAQPAGGLARLYAIWALMTVLWAPVLLLHGMAAMLEDLDEAG